MFIDFKSILYMAPNDSYCFWNKHCFLTSKTDSNDKRSSLCPDTNTMLPTLLNKRDLYMSPEIQKLWFFLQVNKPNIFLKEMCQKSKMDTTIDFVKYPEYSRINTFLKTIPKNNLE